MEDKSFDSTTALKIWLDKYKFQGEGKALQGGIYPNYKLFIITSNYRATDFWKSQICPFTKKERNEDLNAIIRRCEYVELASTDTFEDVYAAISSSVII